jgi:hypothetical protein
MANCYQGDDNQQEGNDCSPLQTETANEPSTASAKNQAADEKQRLASAHLLQGEAENAFEDWKRNRKEIVHCAISKESERQNKPKYWISPNPSPL